MFWFFVSCVLFDFGGEECGEKMEEKQLQLLRRQPKAAWKYDPGQ